MRLYKYQSSVALQGPEELWALWFLSGSRQTLTETGGEDSLSGEGWSQGRGERSRGGDLWGLMLDFELISEVSYIVREFDSFITMMEVQDAFS